MMESQYLSIMIAGFLWAACIVGITEFSNEICIRYRGWPLPRTVKIGLPLALGAISGLFLSAPVLGTIGVAVIGYGDGAFFGLGAGTAAHTVFALVENRLKAVLKKDES